VRAAHAAFQEEALRRCCQGAGRGRGATWRHIGAGLTQLFDVALRVARGHARLLQLREGGPAPGPGVPQCAGSGSGGRRAGTGATQRREAAEAAAAGGGGGGGGGAQRQGAAAGAAAALEVAALRGELAAAAAAWRAGRDYLLRILRNKALQLGGDDDVESLLGALGFNAYYAE
jgi:hypothetical protein